MLRRVVNTIEREKLVSRPLGQTVDGWAGAGARDGGRPEMPVCRLIPFHPRAFSMHYTRGRRQDRHYSMGFGAISHFFPAMKRDCEKSTASTCPAETCTTASSAGGLPVVFGNGEGVTTSSIVVLRSWGLLRVSSSTVAALLDLELGTSELTAPRAPLATCAQSWL